MDDQPLNYWTFVEFFNRKAQSSMPWLDVEAATFFMTISRALELMMYDTRAELGNKMSPATFRVLIALSAAGPKNVGDLSQITGMSKSALSSLLQRTDKDEFTDRANDPDDGRGILVSITDHGRNTMEQVYKDYNRRERMWLEQLDERTASQVRLAFTSIADNIPNIRTRF